MKKTKNIIMIIFAILPLVICAMFYTKLPDQIVTSWGLNGDVDYGSKSTIWVIALMAPVMAAMFKFLPKIDPRKDNYKKFADAYDGFCIVMELFMTVMVGIMISEALNPGKINISMVVCALCGGLFVFLGNMMPRVKSNFFMGIKTPWTLSSQNVWDKTHRLGGRLMFLAGILIILLSFIVQETVLFVAFFIILFASTLIPTIMSYIWFKEEQK